MRSTVLSLKNLFFFITKTQNHYLLNMLISLFYVQIVSSTSKSGLNLLSFLLFLVEFNFRFITQFSKKKHHDELLYLINHCFSVYIISYYDEHIFMFAVLCHKIVHC